MPTPTDDAAGGQLSSASGGGSVMTPHVVAVTPDSPLRTGLPSDPAYRARRPSDAGRRS
jgi:hypothetical protein